MKVDKSLWKLTKAMIFHDIFLVQPLIFIWFRSIVMYYWHFVISYSDEWYFSVCYRRYLRPWQDVQPSLVKIFIRFSAHQQNWKCRTFMNVHKRFLNPTVSSPLNGNLFPVLINSSILWKTPHVNQIFHLHFHQSFPTIFNQCQFFCINNLSWI